MNLADYLLAVTLLALFAVPPALAARELRRRLLPATSGRC
jgi:hypothetical protein